MWKLIAGFIVFAAIAILVIMKGGDKLDMSGEKHGADAVSTEGHAPAAAQAATPAPAAAK